MFLRFALVQSDIKPNAVQKNLEHYRQMLDDFKKNVDVIIFPELFNVGVSSSFGQHAESMEGNTINFLHEISSQREADIVASLPIKEGDKIFNRLVWVTPDGVLAHYDKRHLFFGNEKAICTPGSKRQFVERKGWKFLPQICYDVRFPLWSRNRFQENSFDYDVLIFIANFPEARIKVLRTLAQARAIENQAYVVVVNRIGKDGNGVAHNGNSMIIDPLGRIVTQTLNDVETILDGTASKRILLKVREELAVAPDWDTFTEF
ncbi:MAG TPA: nitrilase-related carbon-nitrogen hydrolase [Bacteroidales bacterium]|jgi:predicted amidohydrolase|nr:nitrilase-related carbon-nitrogen hydrolase [Bacteroidales bacterium]HQA86933.1 nitrilase-related carbon-nitrogen hydrolase [Bacteroidales bacterium]